MKTIDEMLDHARRGDTSYRSEIFNFIKNFQHIILRGAGKFGSSFGSFLIEAKIDINKICYWDIRATELMKINGIVVTKPFAFEFNRDTTLVINCIPNGSLSGSSGGDEFKTSGYHHHLSGMALFEALMCKMNPETGFDASICIKTNFCNWASCKRLPSLLQLQCKTNNNKQNIDELVFGIGTFAINQKCTLQCSHCGQYINHYSAEDRINFPLERIKIDIDRMLDAVDSIGYISIIGGEPFIHPALNEIIEHILTKPNFGVIGITTNGICKITKKHLKTLNNGKTRVIFSDYSAALTEKQRKIFLLNVEKIAAAGISFTVGKPLWATPSSMTKVKCPDVVKIAMKSMCNSTITCKTIQNGVYYPCSATAAVNTHHLAQYELDQVVIDHSTSANDLRSKIKMIDNRTFYESCEHCCDGGESLSISGEQGIDLRYLHIEKR